MAKQHKTYQVAVAEDLTLHVEASHDSGRPVLFVPGWTMTTEVYEKQLTYFGETNAARFITYDPRSHGRSSDTPGGHYYEQHGRDLHGLIDAMALDDVVLGGWSFGVLDVLAYLDQFGVDRVSGVILLDGCPKSRGADNETEWVSYRYDDADGREEFFTMGPLRDRAATNIEFAKWMLEDQSSTNIDWIGRLTNKTRPEVAALLNATGAFLDYTDLLTRLDGTLPLLHIVSEAIAQPAERWSRQHTPNAKVIGFGKHLMFWERPEVFNRHLQAFLDSLPSR